MKSKTSHDIKHRKVPNDEFYTPIDLVRELLRQTPFTAGDTLLDSAYGTGNFYKNFPEYTKNSYSQNFFDETELYDWIITNPPYSKLDAWIQNTCAMSTKGFALLIGLHNLTPKRIEAIEKGGFGITKIILCKVFKWFGISAYIICEKHKKSIIEYNRTVWYDSTEVKADGTTTDGIPSKTKVLGILPNEL